MTFERYVQPIYPETGFIPFKCLDCKTNVKLQGKRIFTIPLRWVTLGFCKTPGCRMEGTQISTRIEYINPKTRLIEVYVEDPILGDDDGV